MSSAELAKRLIARPDVTVGVAVFHNHLERVTPSPEHSDSIYSRLSRWLLEHLGPTTHDQEGLFPNFITPIGYTSVLGQLMVEADLGIDESGNSILPGTGVRDDSINTAAKCEYLIAVSGAAAGAVFEEQVREQAILIGMIPVRETPAAA